MKARALWQVTVATTREAEEAVADLLARVSGAPPAITHDARRPGSKVAVFLDTPAAWTPARAAALRAGLRHAASCGLDTAPGRVRVRRLPATDWAESWKRHFPPLEMGGRLLIKPGWSRRRPRAGQAMLVLDPGLSFGTGQHPTTAFCLAQLVRARRPGASQSLLDAGTGSGILALAAARLGYEPVLGFDSDPEAIRIARENAARNRLGGAVTFAGRAVGRRGAGDRRRWDVVCANLTADLLLAHAAWLRARVAAGGLLVLAGILDAEFAPVQRRYEAAGMGLRATRRVKEWRSAAFAAA